MLYKLKTVVAAILKQRLFKSLATQCLRYASCRKLLALISMFLMLTEN